MNKYVRMVDRIARAEEIQLYTENRCDALEKENAELKKRADKADLDSILFFNQLCKAKEIIREFMKYEINEYDGSLEIHC